MRELSSRTDVSTLTARCKPASLISWLNATMPTTLQERMAEVMKEMSWDHADVMRVTKQSSSLVSQWIGINTSKTIKSIGKFEAAERMQAQSGYRALWIARGIGPKRVADAAPMGSAAVPGSLIQRIEALDEPDRAALLGAVDGMLMSYEAKTKASPRKRHEVRK